jgi:hypothetical protein
MYLADTREKAGGAKGRPKVSDILNRRKFLLTKNLEIELVIIGHDTQTFNVIKIQSLYTSKESRKGRIHVLPPL